MMKYWIRCQKWPKNKRAHFIQYQLRALLPAIFLFGAVFLGCQKQGSQIGAEIMPAEDQLLISTKAGEIVSTTIPSVPVTTHMASQALIGSYLDPVFGLTNASFFSQFLPIQDIPPWIGSSALGVVQFDSIVLNLAYASIYGSLAPLSFNVYELKDPLFRDSIYYPNSSVSYNNNLLGSAEGFVPDLTSNINIIQDTIERSFPPHLRIRLNDRFGLRIFEASQENLTRQGFANFIKGLAVVPSAETSPSAGAILTFNLASVASSLTIYYTQKQARSGTTDSISFVRSYNFLINENAVRFNRYEFNYDNTPVGQAVTDTTIGMEKVYVQGMGGAAAKFYLPDIPSLFQGQNVIINQAQLIVPAIIADTSIFPPPSRLNVVFLDSLGARRAILDFFEGSDVFGGTLSGNEYRFNIGRHVHSLLMGRKHYGMLLYPFNPATTPNRVMLQGAGADMNNMRLRIIYTKIE
jgi:hypothetical protein